MRVGIAVTLLSATVMTALGVAGSSSASRGGVTQGAAGSVSPSVAVTLPEAPAPAPRTWGSATIASGGASLFYPAGWRPIPGDRGTVSVALRDRMGLYRGYLNVTPRQGAESLAGWASFRTARNTADGDRRLREVTAAENLRFTNAHGSCVVDDYLSRIGSHPYRELACIVAGKRYTSVFIGAALLSDWPELGPVALRAAEALVVR
jgi:hypothetical protein